MAARPAAGLKSARAIRSPHRSAIRSRRSRSNNNSTHRRSSGGSRRRNSTRKAWIKRCAHANAQQYGMAAGVPVSKAPWMIIALVGAVLAVLVVGGIVMAVVMHN